MGDIGDDFRIMLEDPYLDIEQCCNEPNIQDDLGTQVCTNCGLVRGQTITKHQTRAFNKQENENRVHHIPFLRKSGPRTVVSREKHDGMGKYLSGKTKLHFYKLSCLHNRTSNSIEVNYLSAVPLFNTMVHLLEIPEHVQELTWKIYKRVVENKLVKGRLLNIFVGASLYVACRIHKLPIVMTDIEVIIRKSKKLKKSKSTFFHYIDLIKTEILPELGLKYELQSLEGLVNRFSYELELSWDLHKSCINLAKVISKIKRLYDGGSILGVVGAIIYIITKPTKFKKYQDEMAKYLRITAVTIRLYIKKIKEIMRRVIESNKIKNKKVMGDWKRCLSIL